MYCMSVLYTSCIYKYSYVLIMYLYELYCMVVGQQQQRPAALIQPAAQPQAQGRAPPPARQDPYQGKGVSV